MTDTERREALELMRSLMKQYPNDSEEQLQRRFMDEYERDPSRKESLRREVLNDVLREIERRNKL
jgi:hypothetical protein